MQIFRIVLNVQKAGSFYIGCITITIGPILLNKCSKWQAKIHLIAVERYSNLLRRNLEILPSRFNSRIRVYIVQRGKEMGLLNVAKWFSAVRRRGWSVIFILTSTGYWPRADNFLTPVFFLKLSNHRFDRLGILWIWKDCIICDGCFWIIYYSNYANSR